MNTATKAILAALVAGFLVLTVYVLVGGGVKTIVEQQLGSVSNPDIQSPYFSFGGVKHWGARDDDLTQATTTVCALQSPASTSTLQFGSVRFSTGTSSATVVTLAKAANAFATTTLITNTAVGAGAVGTIIATSTSNTEDPLDQPITFGPNQWFVVGVAGAITQGDAAGLGYRPVGTCQAIWIEN